MHMAGKRDAKGKTPMRRVSIADGDGSPLSRPATPGPSNTTGRNAAHESPALSNDSSASGSRAKSEATHQTTSAQSSASTAPCSAPGQQIPANRYSALPTPFPQPFGSWRPMLHPQGSFGLPMGPYGNQFVSMANLQPAQPVPAPPTNNPPDPLGPPPPPPPPPAIPPVLNPHGIHFQPQVPSTEMGPMIHRYTPRQDPPYAPGMILPGQQLPGVMANGTVLPLQPMPGGVAAVTAPMNPVVIQQPVGLPVMIANQAVQGSAPLMLPGRAPAIQVPGNPSLVPGLPAQPPVHVEPALGVGLTPNETMAENMRIAQDNKAYEPQDFMPADPDPYRLYWFRELNGHWAVFSRRQIDRLCARWYRTDDGVFYAVRLSE